LKIELRIIGKNCLANSNQEINSKKLFWRKS